MPNGSNASASRSSGKSGGRFPTKTLPLLFRIHINSPLTATPAGLFAQTAAQGATPDPPRSIAAALGRPQHCPAIRGGGGRLAMRPIAPPPPDRAAFRGQHRETAII